jgi:hypothetical protein
MQVLCLIAGCTNGMLKLFNTVDGTALKEFQAHASPIETLSVDNRKR